MISEKMQVALNEQLNKELFSSYLYKSMAAYFEDKNYTGMAHWMKMQAEEEHIHATKLYDFIIKVGSRVRLKAIDEPQFEWASPKAAFEAAYEHEQFISKNINDLLDLAIDERDHATSTFLHWYVDEQVEEEANAAEIVRNFEMVEDSKGGLFLLDRELANRAAPAAAV